ncbi:MAG: hypothetical protein H6559_34180 [Lewinellaceae bacterium]|nr:hypothetical protein [Lewinellaceae bacterium]
MIKEDSMVKLSNFHQLLGIIGAGVRHHYIEAAGIRTSFLEAGAGTALVLLHGAGGGAVTGIKLSPPGAPPPGDRFRPPRLRRIGKTQRSLR